MKTAKLAGKMNASDYRELAKQAANNHAKFDCFVWFGAPDDEELWTIVYTNNRDGDALTRANHKVIAKELEQFGDDVRAESHSHWACGYVDGFAIRVYRQAGRIRRVTDAFKAWCDIHAALDDYPVLDEELWSAEESTDEDEAWDSWAQSEFTRELESTFGVEIDGELSELFRTLAERANVYWQHDSGGASIDIGRIVESAELDDLRPFVVEQRVRVYRDGFPFVDGSIGADAVADMSLYADEFAACMEAREQGAESVQIGQHVFTWNIQ